MRYMDSSQASVQRVRQYYDEVMLLHSAPNGSAKTHSASPGLVTPKSGRRKHHKSLRLNVNELS
jgi:hypothetical protein